MDTVHLATQIVMTLRDAGYIAYFAGGWVRDCLLKHPSDDIDIATNAPPEKVLELFPSTILVGVSFGVVIVTLNGHKFEVTSFRREGRYLDGRRPEIVELATAEEDASRRDFTINGMFFDPIHGKILDFVNGQHDLQQGIIRTIGNPQERFIEDRLRMIRAVRFAARFDFILDPAVEEAIKQNAHTLLPAVALERIWQEFQKMSKAPRFSQAIVDLHRLGLLPVIFPSLEGIPLMEIENRVSVFPQFLPGTPVILYLMELFPNVPLSELLQLCYYLRVSAQEGKWVEYSYQISQLIKMEEVAPHAIDAMEWTRFYAHQFFDTCLGIIAARCTPESRSALYEKHLRRRESLWPHIQRVAEKKPLVTASLLQDQGIVPGKLMGDLLREAERIAVTQDIHDTSEIISLLKKHPLWPQNEK